MASKLQRVQTPGEKKSAADGFFTSGNQQPNTELSVSEISTKVVKAASTPGKGGRPKKIGLKNENFSLTMNPETYEKLRIVASEECNGNISQLIDLACRHYCDHIGLNLRNIRVPQEIIDEYTEKQNKSKKSK